MGQNPVPLMFTSISRWDLWMWITQIWYHRCHDPWPNLTWVVSTKRCSWAQSGRTWPRCWWYLWKCKRKPWADGKNTGKSEMSSEKTGENWGNCWEKMLLNSRSWWSNRENHGAIWKGILRQGQVLPPKELCSHAALVRPQLENLQPGAGVWIEAVGCCQRSWAWIWYIMGPNEKRKHTESRSRIISDVSSIWMDLSDWDVYIWV